MGQNEIVRLRQQWLARRPAPEGGVVAFNDAVLHAGNLPLGVLEQALAAA